MIILSILKIIGIVLACIVGFILLLILAVLFIPLRYKITALGENTDMEADAEVTWGFRLAKAAVSWREKKLSYRVNAVGKTIVEGVVFGEDEKESPDEAQIETEPATAPQKNEEAAIPLRKSDASGKTQIVEEKEPKKEISDEPAAQRTEPEAQAPEETEEAEAAPEETAAETEDVSEEAAEAELSPEETVTEAGAAPEKKEKTEPDTVKQESAAEEKCSEPEEDEAADSEKSDKKSIKDKARDIRDKISRIRAKIEEYQKKYEEIMRFWNAKTTKRALKKTKIQLLHILNHLKPRKITGSLKFGLPDPADTAILYGNAAPVLEAVAKGKLVITPAFYEAGVDADLSIRGRIFLGYMVLCLGRIYLDIDVQRVIKYVRRNLNG